MGSFCDNLCIFCHVVLKNEAFNLRDGELAGVFPTCTGPRGLTYLPWRQEVWFRCVSPNEDDEDDESGYWDSFSTTSITENFPEISLKSERSIFLSSPAAQFQPMDIATCYTSDCLSGLADKSFGRESSFTETKTVLQTFLSTLQTRWRTWQTSSWDWKRRSLSTCKVVVKKRENAADSYSKSCPLRCKDSRSDCHVSRADRALS